MKITSKMCMQKDLGMNGNLFGGNLLKWADEAAAIFAHQYTGEKRMVTLFFDSVTFKHPVHMGDIIEFYAEGEKTGKTSLSFRLIAYVNGIGCVFDTNCVFVAIDKTGKKKEITSKKLEAL